MRNNSVTTRTSSIIPQVFAHVTKIKPLKKFHYETINLAKIQENFCQKLHKAKFSK